MFGGCNEEAFVRRFTKILNATNAKVVVAAEYNCWEIKNCQEFPDTNREKVLQAFSLTKDAVDGWARADEAKAYGPYSLKYLNSGFYAAYNKDMKWFVSEVLRHYDEHPNRIIHGMSPAIDQAYFAMTFIENQDKIVLDYAGALVNCLYAVEIDKDNPKLYQFQQTPQTAWVNSILNDDVCFFHGNGQGKPVLQDLINEQGNATG